jgi:histidinol-phosphate aminotransferase
MEQIDQQVVHGALDYGELEQLGLRSEEILDFSVNANPYGPSPQVRQAIAQVAIDRYPDRKCLELRRALLAYELHGTPLALDSILWGNGTAELIWAIARALLQSGSKAAILGPTFGEYAAASRAIGAQVVEYRAAAETQFHFDLAEMIAWLQAERPTILWLCNPNSPTGTWLNQQAMARIADACAHVGTALVVDEAYWHFLSPQESFSAITLLDRTETTSLIVLRSLTKAYALAGLRLGYALASASVIRQIYRQLPPWNVNSFAQAAGIAALADRAHCSSTLAELAVQRGNFFHALCVLNVPVMPSRTHFCLIDVGDAHVVRQQLLNKRLLVRDCTSRIAS